jgi:hypothetical protein
MKWKDSCGDMPFPPFFLCCALAIDTGKIVYTKRDELDKMVEHFNVRKLTMPSNARLLWKYHLYERFASHFLPSSSQRTLLAAVVNRCLLGVPYWNNQILDI